jgi:hypothetical protein
VQVRRAIAGRLTRAAEQAFLTALAATCNVTLAAAAVGVSPRAFYRRKMRDPAFAREMRQAVKRGYARLELALLESGVAGADGELDWRSNEPPALPPMSVSQALQLMYLHQKEAQWRHEPWPIRRLRGESLEAHCYRLETMAEARRQEQRDAFDMAEAERWAEGQPAWGPAGEAVRGELGLPEDGGHDRFLPDLAQVAGWSRAQGRVHDAGTALFGGWRLEHVQAFDEAQGEATQPGCRGASRTVGSNTGEGLDLDEGGAGAE